MDYEIGEERKRGELIKTGQTTQYGGYEDDGYFEKGLSKRYTVLTTGQYSGTTDITLNSKTDIHSNNCVYDERTKLMWSRYTVGTVGPGSNGLLPWTTNGNGEGIFPFADAANAALLGGYSDWRVPNFNELLSLPSFDQAPPRPNQTAFPEFPTDNWFWTSTTFLSDIDYSMRVYFEGLYINPYLKTQPYYLLLVRGG